jgi:transposase InsO family protein
MPVVNITQDVAVKFLTDNGTQFKGAKFVRCCTDFDINH